MTVPSERFRSIQNVREFLYDLVDRKKTPRIPKEIRIRAGRLLKHYPIDLHMEKVAENVPEDWSAK